MSKQTKWLIAVGVGGALIMGLALWGQAALDGGQCPTTAESEYFSTVALMMDTQSNQFAKLQAIIMAYDGSSAWENQTLDHLIRMQRTSRILPMVQGPASINDIRDDLIDYSAFQGEFLLRYAQAASNDLDPSQVEAATEYLRHITQISEQVEAKIAAFCD